MLTFVDSGVLIAAARGVGDVSARAMAILTDPTRQFVSSDFVRLEVLPKPVYHQRAAEAAFYQAFFAAVALWVPASAALMQQALSAASGFGLGAMDALHVAATQLARADDLVTSESASKPLCRVSLVRVVSLNP